MKVVKGGTILQRSSGYALVVATLYEQFLPRWTNLGGGFGRPVYEIRRL